MSIRHLLIGLLLAGSLAACFDHRDLTVTPGSSASRLRVKSITMELPNNLAKVSQFRYDAQNRLSSILTYQTPDSSISEIEYSNYQYDAQNRLTRLHHEAVLYPRGSQPNRVEQYDYLYNTAGQVSQLTHSPGEPGYVLGFNYNSAGQLTSSGRFYSTGGLQVQGLDVFTFSGKNLTADSNRTTIIAKGGPAIPSSGTTRFTYDDKVNPFYGVYVIPAPYPNGFVNPRFSPSAIYTYFGGIDNALNLSQNNVLTSVPNGGGRTFTYQYQYNAQNLPTMRIRTTTYSPPNSTVEVETLRFEYESY
ncbi:hypothetical protein HNV11_12575 [Spirosoma taeanense]|uniref:YD repeat-containing protein n=1 Tax=Spirosoma taeanense TaxID=2735870 RepID=A0A6M5YAA1_9BACT|nr:hypothetical protein [Spirosoma taeanense]QJW90151.1 hypothetical protein HNV11_12575 [Spirosoma taeanense]